MNGLWHRPLASLTLAYAAGVWLVATLRPSLGDGGAVPLGALLAATVAGAAATGWLSLRRGSAVPGAVFLLLLSCAAGGIRAGQALAPLPGPLGSWLGRRVILTGVVQPDSRPDRLVLRVEQVGGASIPRLAQPRVLVRLAGHRPAAAENGPDDHAGPAWRAGDRVRAAGRLETPRGPGNPGEFDARAHLARRGIRGILLAREADVERAGRAPAGPQGAAASVRLALGRVYRETLPPVHAAVLEGLLYGTTDAIPAPTREAFRVTGVFHLLAVSGSNVAFVILSATLAMRALRVPAGVTVPAGLAIIAFYALLAEGDASVVRASVMGGLALVAGVARRRRDFWTALAAAALAILAWEPLALYEPGFQLSFAATAGLATMAGPLGALAAARLPAVPRAPLGVTAATAAAEVAVAPLAAWHFNALPAYGLVANLVAVPLAGWLVVSGGAAGLLGLVWLPLAAAVNLVNRAALGLLLAAVEGIGRLPGALLAVPTPRPAWVALYFLGLAVAFGWVPARHARAARRLLAAGALVVLLSLLATIVFPRPLEVVFYDVGQGDAALVLTPARGAVLIDGGSASGWDHGERVILPDLRRRGIRRVAWVVLSHPHEDHVGGLVSVVRQVRVGAILDSGQPNPIPAYEAILRAALDRSVPFVVGRRGDSFDLGRGARLQVLHPPEPLLSAAGSDLNANSLVLRLEYGRASFLLTGDLEGAAEAELVRHAGAGLQATVLKVGHHGAASATGEDLVAAVRPRVAVIQVGANSFGHPSAAVVRRLEAAGARVLRTDLDGAVTLATDGRRLTVSAWRSRERFTVDLEPEATGAREAGRSHGRLRPLARRTHPGGEGGAGEAQRVRAGPGLHQARPDPARGPDLRLRGVPA